MKRFRQSLITVNLLIFAISVILLLNITAPNPTGRRYSSQVIDLSLSFVEKGFQGEMILSRDLGVVRNENVNRLCLCTAPAGNRSSCGSCAANITTFTHDRRPDFFTDTFIGEVKNHNGELYTRREHMEQIQDYVVGALVVERPLWLFVRTDSLIPDDLRRLVQSTGGDIVPYLATPDYVDETDRIAYVLLALSTFTLILLLVWELELVQLTFNTTPRTPREPQVKIKVDNTDDFINRAKSSAQAKIDKSDAWIDQNE